MSSDLKSEAHFSFTIPKLLYCSFLSSVASTFTYIQADVNRFPYCYLTAVVFYLERSPVMVIVLTETALTFRVNKWSV